VRLVAGALVMVHLVNPTEKFWGLLEALEPVGVTFRGISLDMFEEWMVEVSRGAPSLGLATMFVPLFRVERIYLDEAVGEVESYRQRFERRVGAAVERYLDLRPAGGAEDPFRGRLRMDVLDEESRQSSRPETDPRRARWKPELAAASAGGRAAETRRRPDLSQAQVAHEDQGVGARRDRLEPGFRAGGEASIGRRAPSLQDLDRGDAAPNEQADRFGSSTLRNGARPIVASPSAARERWAAGRGGAVGALAGGAEPGACAPRLWIRSASVSFLGTAVLARDRSVAFPPSMTIAVPRFD
jgi:hypothetical protein